ncbi:SRPBCC domain-containing protein [Acidicapsa dinghuensis]|uniref:SRPBCC domain-containing protein n=1 Tax=Acidicapsa dinghuensis TaxID=2218256 RepID=A0ABW1EG36_9BACT|nr:SRPBCC domain-containing protein [Acidicapsa dinghuensis]
MSREREFVYLLELDAPRELVWKTWTEEEHLKQWFAPAGFALSVAKLNVVSGGIFHYCMRAANGVEMWGKWVFREVVAPERIVLVNTFSNKHGNPTRHPYVADWPLEILTTATFADVDGNTVLTIAWHPIDASPSEQKTFDSMHDAMTQGWNGTLGQLEAYLKGRNQGPETN